MAQSVAVPLLDLKAQYRQIEAEIMAMLPRLCASQHFILGQHVVELEERIAQYCQCRFGIGVSSGTDALLVALMALDVGPGDEVITTPYTFFATAGVIARLGARPLFCDIDPLTFNLAPAAVKGLIATQCERRDGKLVNRQTGGVVKALLPVHLYGQMADMDALMKLAQQHGLKVVEDAAQAIGAEDQNGRRAGSIGDIGCFSFFPSKNLGAFGDGGMCTTNDPVLAERLKVLRVHGSSPKYYHALIGGNFRLDELQAAVLLVKLKYLDGWTAARQANARYYTQAFTSTKLSGKLTPPSAAAGRHIYNQYVIRTPQRDALRTHLADAGIVTEIYYPVPLDRQACFAYLNLPADGCPESAKAASETIALPIYPELTDAQKRHVVETVAGF